MGVCLSASKMFTSPPFCEEESERDKMGGGGRGESGERGERKGREKGERGKKRERGERERGERERGERERGERERGERGERERERERETSINKTTNTGKKSSVYNIIISPTNTLLKNSYFPWLTHINSCSMTVFPNIQATCIAAQPSGCS